MNLPATRPPASHASRCRGRPEEPPPTPNRSSGSPERSGMLVGATQFSRSRLVSDLRFASSAGSDFSPEQPFRSRVRVAEWSHTHAGSGSAAKAEERNVCRIGREGVVDHEVERLAPGRLPCLQVPRELHLQLRQPREIRHAGERRAPPYIEGVQRRKGRELRRQRRQPAAIAQEEHLQRRQSTGAADCHAQRLQIVQLWVAAQVKLHHRGGRHLAQRRRQQIQRDAAPTTIAVPAARCELSIS